MASETIIAPISIPAGSDLSTKQFYFVYVNSSGQLAIPSLSGHSADGVLQDTPNAAGRPGMVCGPGSITKVISGGSITAGMYLMTDGSGKAVQATSGSIILGRALDDASSSDIFRMRMMSLGRL